jgi:hypothetical protein
VTLRTILSLFALSMLGAGTVSAQSGARVTFRFGWKPGIVADVTSVTALSGMSPTTPGDTSGTIIRSTMRQTIEAHPQGLLVRTAPVELNPARQRRSSPRPASSSRLATRWRSDG